MLSQYVHDKVLADRKKGLTGRITAVFWNEIRKTLLKFHDPLVVSEIGSYTLQLPLSHNLPLYLKSYPKYSRNLAEIAKTVYEKYSNLTLIDIGANIGDSVALVKTKIDIAVLCIEGLDCFYDILKENAKKFSNVYLEKSYVGEMTCEIKAQPLKASGTMQLNEKTDEVIQIRKLSDILVEYPFFADCKMIKIDTDGFDCKILRGAADILKMAKPVIFFEYDPYLLSNQDDDGLSVFQCLQSCGYKSMLVYDNIGDYMLSAELANSVLLADIHNYFTGHKGMKYCDICVFHSEDSDLLERIRGLELLASRDIK